MRNILGLIAVLAAPLLLTACLLTPGKFTSNLDIERDGTFTFTYDGEIFMAGMSSIMDMAAMADKDEFEAECYTDDYDPRECSAEEVAEQRAEWEEKAAQRAAEKARSAEMMKRMMGDLDPSDPEAVDEYVKRMAKQKGWKSVIHRGEGVFDISYEMRGNMDRNFQFPVLERTEGITPFVIAIVRNDGTVRIDAPGFATKEQSGLSGMMGFAATIGDSDKNDGDGEDRKLPAIPIPDGVFTVTTDAEILTNNTEEGPSISGDKRILSWTITPRTENAPETLLRLSQ